MSEFGSSPAIWAILCWNLLQKNFPHRFVNAGVAEQNMTGVAAGLSLSGKIVFTYSIANLSYHPMP